MNSIRNIIFDYGGVIFDIEHERTARAFEELGVPQIRTAFSHEVQNGFFLDFETGKLSEAAFRDAIRELSGAPLSHQQIDAAWNALLLGVPEGNILLLLQLKEKYRTFLLSNNNPIHYTACAAILDEQWKVSIEECLEKAYFSHLIQMRKPDAGAYRYVLETHLLRPEETIFIDDTPKNIRAAGALGLQTRLVARNEPLHQVVAPFL